MKYLKRLSKRKWEILGVGLLAVVGMALLATSHATTATSSLQPESGMISSAADLVNDSTASNAKAIKFGDGVVATTRTTNCLPVANATMTNTISHLCGFADTTNTGVPDSITPVLVNATTNSSPNSNLPSDNRGWHWASSWGGIYVDTDNAIVDGVKVVGGDIIIHGANGATIKNSDISFGGSGFGIEFYSGSNATIENNNIHGTAATSAGTMQLAWGDVSNSFGGAQILNNNVWWIGGGGNVNYGTVKNNYIHDIIYQTNAHDDGIQNFAATTNLLTIQDNTILNPLDQTGGVLLANGGSSATGVVQTNKVISHNLFAGFGFAIYAGCRQTATSCDHLTITDNHFSRLYYPESGSNNYADSWLPNASGNIWNGNVWDDTGASVAAPQ